jgi:tetratricopeptide (TPR) repeat protein
LLIRIYSRVNDSVAATEIAEEYMAKTGKNEVEQLQEKGRIFQICNDYWNYEQVIERLIEVDPEGKTEYLRQLALSMLERGKAQQARAVLMKLRDADDGKDSIGGEFEAGVLSLVGMNAEAASAYRQGIATHPDRIESYLLLANLLKEMGQTDRAVGMFPYLAENADRDDLFTIAIDGLLNMEAERPVMQWARRITLERLAGREDKNYLYQLLADLSAEVNDKAGQIRALENSLAVSGTRRLSVLRECMELSSKIRGGSYYSSSSRGPTNKGNQPFFAFGRRLIGLGELMPPQVFLDLGQAFLDNGDTRSAERTFALARNLADPRGYQREVAEIFEKAGRIPEALVRYDKLLRTSPSDVALIARVAKLNEQVGKDEAAFRFYQRGLNLLLSQTPLTTQEEAKTTSTRYWSTNRDAYQTYSDQLLQGLLVTVADDQVDTLFNHQQELLQQSLRELDQVVDAGRIAEQLADSPRIDKRSSAMRRMYFAFARIEELEAMDQLLINRFRQDSGLLISLARERIQRGRYDSVRRMLESSAPSDQQREQLLTMLGDRSNQSDTAKLSPSEMWQRFLPAWMKGDREAALEILRRVDQTKGRAPGSRPSYVIINGMAVLQNSGTASDVAAWMRLAISLGDEGLALRFARSRLASGGRYGATQIKQLFATYQEILPEQPFADLVRYAANLYQNDQARLAEYLWLISQMSQYLGDDIPADQKILEMIEDADLQIGYYFPFELAMEAFPASIRAEAMAKTFDGIVEKYRPRELVRVPFHSDQPIDEATGKVLLEAIKSGIEPALQDNYLRYCTYYLPRSGTAVSCPENAELAIKTMELLMTDNVRKRELALANMAEFIGAVLLHQAGQTEQALAIVLKSYDPKENISDYYHRNARDWAYRELVPVATDRFLQLVDKHATGEEPTIEHTDQRLALIKQAGDEDLLRQAYQRAIKDHPKQTKYATAYEKWEQSLNRVAVVIELTERQLAAAASEVDKENEGDADDDAKTNVIKKRLAALWLSVNHVPNALPYWIVADDQDREQFMAQQQRRAEQAKSKQASPKEKTEGPPQPDAVEKPQRKYAASMSGVKSAIDDEDIPSAQQALRKIWRSLPPAIASPYRSSSSQKRLNGLAWPADQTSKAATNGAQQGRPEQTDEEQQAAADKARRAARGGLATFTPETRPTRTQPPSAWQVLADQPFAVAEMQRIMRSHSSPVITNVRDVSLGLLQAERNQRGDEAVFAALVEKIQAGQISDEVLVHLFAMLEEDYGRINEDNEAVIDVLLDRLDLTNARRASQLAELCAQVGQRKRAIALYQHCALLTTTGSTSLASLIEQAKKSFAGDELMSLAESMFALTSQNATESAQILELRLDLLDPAAAADRSRQLFASDFTADKSGELGKAMRGVPVFARAGDDQLAGKCLSFALRRHGQPRVSSSNSNNYCYSPSSSRNLLRVTRDDLIRMFPAAADGYADYDQWLRAAAQTAITVADDAQPEIIVETLLTIALRQCQRDHHNEAADTLSLLTDDMIAGAKQHQSLAIDVMRLAGSTDQALQLQTKLHDQKRLSHLRFGDLLRDTAAIKGQAAAAELLEELVARSMDEDLILAASEIAVGNDALIGRAEQLRSQFETAQSEYKSRLEAARQRAETRKQWSAEDATAKAKANS